MSSDIGAVMISFNDALNSTGKTTNFHSAPKVLGNSYSNTDEGQESDTTSEESDQEEHNDLFLEEYFHQQFLRMQALYPPTFKSKLGNQDHNLQETERLPTSHSKFADTTKSSSVKTSVSTKARFIPTIPTYNSEKERRRILLQESALKGSNTANPSQRISKKVMNYKNEKKEKVVNPSGTVPDIHKLIKKFGGFLRGTAK
jgi:hypothetical protein